MESVCYEKQSQRAILTLNRPMKHNALNPEMIHTFQAHLDTIAKDPTISTTLIRAQGKNFCAGADLVWMKQSQGMTNKAVIEDARPLALLLQTLRHLPSVTIACVQGHAVGGAIGLIASCDFAIAANNTIGRLSEVTLGLIPAVISPYLIQRMGMRHALKLSLRATPFTASEGKTWGLFDEVVPLASLHNAVHNLMTDLSQADPESLKACKRLFQTLTQNMDEQAVETMTLGMLAEQRSRAVTQQRIETFLTNRQTRPPRPSCE